MSVFNSGNWLMTAKRRAKEGILQAVGAHQATEDVEFDQRLKNFNAHVSELNKIKDAMDLWIESFDTFCTSSLILGEAFKNFFAQSPFKTGEEASASVSAYANVSAAFDKVMLDINQTVQPAIRETFVNRCLKPTISILSLVPAINEQVQERKTIMLDFDSYKAKIQKEHAAGRDSAHPNVVKKAIKLDDSAKKLYAVQQSIVTSIEEYEAARPIMLGAEFASFIACYYQQSYYSADLSSKLLPIVPQSSSSLNIMDSYILQHNKQKHSLSLVNNERVLSGGYTPPNTSFMSTHFLCELKSRHACPIVEPVLTRTEYLGGSYGGYNTGGDYMRPVTATEDDDDDIHETVAQIVPSSSNSSANGNANKESDDHRLSVGAPVVDAVVIEGVTTELTSPASAISTGGRSSTTSNSSVTSPHGSSVDGSSFRPPPPPKAPRTTIQQNVNGTASTSAAPLPDDHEPPMYHTERVVERVASADSVEAVAHHETAVEPVNTESSAAYLTAIDGSALDDSTNDEAFFTPPTSERIHSGGPPKPPRVHPHTTSAPSSPPSSTSTNPFDE